MVLRHDDAQAVRERVLHDRTRERGEHVCLRELGIGRRERTRERAVERGAGLGKVLERDASRDVATRHQIQDPRGGVGDLAPDPPAR